MFSGLVSKQFRRAFLNALDFALPYQLLIVHPQAESDFIQKLGRLSSTWLPVEFPYLLLSPTKSLQPRVVLQKIL